MSDETDAEVDGQLLHHRSTDIITITETESIDVSEDGNVTFEEFVRLTSGKLKSDDEKTLELEEALKVFDKLGQG